MKELTQEEINYYANYSKIEICDLCGDYFYFLNLHDGDDFVEYNGRQFLCELCRKEF